jgi:S-adenosylmethionine:tRNA ribosyltransferase-isomerase
VDLGEFDYELPPAAIAQRPPPDRDGARLLVIDRHRGTLADHAFRDLPGLLRPGDCVVVNDSRVIPARVVARDPQRRPVELLFVEPQAEGRWRALVRPGRRIRPGLPLTLGDEDGPCLSVTGVEPDGTRVIERRDGTIEDLLNAHGQPPLPPYIARAVKPEPEDWDRYQTVYARLPGSVAAPTAGLHFTPTGLDRLRAGGIEVHALTLHVGPATFQPVRVTNVDHHVVAPERAVISPAVAEAVTRARAEGRRVVAVGTTTTRALEAAATPEGRVEPIAGPVGITIIPGYVFRVVGALVTNFHLPRSSLLLLVSAFAGRSLVLDAYRYAAGAGYRFYSYGDATLIV